MSSNRKHSFGVAANQSSSIQQLILQRLDRSIGSDFIARDQRFRMFEAHSTPRHYSPSAYSIESFADENRHPARATLTKIFNRRRSVTISTSGSSAETATNGVTTSIAFDVLEDQTLLEETPPAKSTEPSDKMSSHHPCISRVEKLPSLNASCEPAREKDQLGVGSNRADLSIHAMITEGRKNGQSARKRAPQLNNALTSSTLAAEKPSTSIRDSLNDFANEDLMPLQTGPRLIHRSYPPWEVSSPDEACASHGKGSGSRFGPDDDESVTSSHYPRQSPSQSQSKTGLKKLFKSVKVSLWSTPSSASANEFPRKTTDDKSDGHGPQHLLSSSNQSGTSDASVDAQSATTLARNHHHLNDFGSVGPDDSTASLSRSVSAHSIFSIGTATTSTVASASITPSSSWSSLPGPQSDSLTHKPGPCCSQDKLPELTISLAAGEIGRHPNMATPHTLTCTHPPSHNFDNSFGTRDIPHMQDHHSSATRVLKAKPSFGFLQNIKRAVTGADPTLSFSFHNHLTPSLTTSAVSLPIGTVLRNNGLDPLPPCHPLPLKSSQSSPSSLDCSLLAPPGHEPQRFESIPSPRAVSLFSSSFGDFSSVPRSEASYLHEPVSQTEVLRVAPTLNLRPVSMPFAAGFSDHFMFDGLGGSSIDHQKHDLGSLPQKQTDEDSCAHLQQCPSCRSLADENVRLMDRIKELEMMVAKTT